MSCFIMRSLTAQIKASSYKKKNESKIENQNKNENRRERIETTTQIERN